MAIEALGIGKSFGDFTALADVDLTVPTGGLTALLGPSGCGKSTLLRVISGLEAPDTGTVALDGVDVTGASAQDRGIGFVFQHYAAFKHMTVAGNIAFGLEVRRKPKAEIKARVAEMLDLVQLTGWADRYPSQLSGGQRQRMALARALAGDPNVLLLDEPFGALDAKVRKELRDWLRRLHDDMGVTTVFVTHDREEALEVSDSIVVMRAGRVEQAGTPEELYERPVNAFVMEFVGPVTNIAGKLTRPHDVDLLSTPTDGAEEVRVERVTRLGFEVRVLCRRPGGETLEVQLSRAEADRLELREETVLWARAHAITDFAAAPELEPA
jgi:sulfate transport system ATP-binding protein